MFVFCVRLFHLQDGHLISSSLAPRSVGSHGDSKVHFSKMHRDEGGHKVIARSYITGEA